MTEQKTYALFCSLCAHLAALGYAWNAVSEDHPAYSQHPAQRAITVNLLKAGAKPAQPALPVPPADNVPPDALPHYRPVFALEDSEPKPAHEDKVFVPSTLLTKLPAPVHRIDLELENRSTGFLPKKIELIILIRANGEVADVLVSENTPVSQEYLDSIALRFKNARFAPGEINGTAVNTRLNIAIVPDS